MNTIVEAIAIDELKSIDTLCEYSIEIDMSTSKGVGLHSVEWAVCGRITDVFSISSSVFSPLRRMIAPTNSSCLFSIAYHQAVFCLRPEGCGSTSWRYRSRSARSKFPPSATSDKRGSTEALLEIRFDSPLCKKYFRHPNLLAKNC